MGRYSWQGARRGRAGAGVCFSLAVRAGMAGRFATRAGAMATLTRRAVVAERKIFMGNMSLLQTGAKRAVA
ncbi:MAG: hypothetical protein CSA74_00620 [Rhodobacterales bacterium]|nr:MAG: hypothetical protein CSA74_00620 [Rhodobacterales bacterium]